MSSPTGRVGGVVESDVESGEVTTVNGAPFTIEVADEGVSIIDGQGNTANVVTTDIVASNGVIHVIDAVLLPASSSVPVRPHADPCGVGTDDGGHGDGGFLDFAGDLRRDADAERLPAQMGSAESCASIWRR
jgi:hypothetical protein